MIYTFYSYKGGTGRSMALANVARWLSLQGLSVLMVDWDLEAPGLEAFFYEKETDRERVRSELGLIDLLAAYKRRFPTLAAATGGEGGIGDALEEHLEPLVNTLCSVDGDKLRLLSAGWRAGDRFTDYALAAQSFDWADFYARYEGEAFFEWFRRQLVATADVTLIDSRTGVTEMGGVCTRHLADVVVSFCAPNVQNLRGVYDVTNSFRRDDLFATRGRELEVLVVPTRIDLSEIDERKRFELEFRETVDRFTPLILRRHKRDFWDLRIPYVPKYAYREKLAVAEPDGVEELQEAYKALAAHLALLAPESRTTLRKVWDVFERSLRGAPTSSRVASVFNLPQSQDPFFTGHAREIDELGKRLHGPNIVALVGLGGIGKTALAVEFAYRNRSNYDVVWLLNASDEASLISGYTALADALGLSARSPDGQVGAARQWLDLNEGWLLILDGAAAPEAVSQYVPRARAGQVIVTSRDSTWARTAPTIAVGPLEPEEAARLVAARTGSTDDEAARELARELGGLPLALTLACGYMAETGRSVRDYLGLLRSEGLKVLGGQLEAATAAAIESAAKASPQAERLLGLAAYYAPDQIPHSVLAADAKLDPLEFDEAIAVLRRHALLDVGEGSVRFHPLVQLFARQHRRPVPSDVLARQAPPTKPS